MMTYRFAKAIPKEILSPRGLSLKKEAYDENLEP
jgi:hypothetical protein